MNQLDIAFYGGLIEGIFIGAAMASIAFTLVIL